MFRASGFLAVPFGAFSRRGCGSVWRDVTVDHILQLLARLEEGDLLSGDLDTIAGLGIASDAGLALPGAEAAKAADLNLVACAQGAHHALKDGLYNNFAV